MLISRARTYLTFIIYYHSTVTRKTQLVDCSSHLLTKHGRADTAPTGRNYLFNLSESWLDSLRVRSRHDKKGLARMWKKANKRCDVREKRFRVWPYHHSHRVTKWERKRSSVRAFLWRQLIGLTLPSPAAFHTVCFTTKHTWQPGRDAGRSIAYRQGGGETKEQTLITNMSSLSDRPKVNVLASFARRSSR